MQRTRVVSALVLGALLLGAAGIALARPAILGASASGATSAPSATLPRTAAGVSATKATDAAKVTEAEAIATSRTQIAAGYAANATKVVATKVRFSDDMVPATVVAPGTLAWVVSYDGITVRRHGGPRSTQTGPTWTQMNVVVDASTGAVLEAYPGMTGVYPGDQ